MRLQQERHDTSESEASRVRATRCKREQLDSMSEKEGGKDSKSDATGARAGRPMRERGGQIKSDETRARERQAKWFEEGDVKRRSSGSKYVYFFFFLLLFWNSEKGKTKFNSSFLNILFCFKLSELLIILVHYFCQVVPPLQLAHTRKPGAQKFRIVRMDQTLRPRIAPGGALEPASGCPRYNWLDSDWRFGAFQSNQLSHWTARMQSVYGHTFFFA